MLTQTGYICLTPALIVGCIPHPAMRQWNHQLGLANPASKYCEDVGGWIVLDESPERQAGYCHLLDGGIIEEWNFFTTRNEEQ